MASLSSKKWGWGWVDRQEDRTRTEAQGLPGGAAPGAVSHEGGGTHHVEQSSRGGGDDRRLALQLPCPSLPPSTLRLVCGSRSPGQDTEVTAFPEKQNPRTDSKQ